MAASAKASLRMKSRLARRVISFGDWPPLLPGLEHAVVPFWDVTLHPPSYSQVRQAKDLDLTKFAVGDAPLHPPPICMNIKTKGLQIGQFVID